MTLKNYELQGIGGWLILVAIGVVIAPIRLLVLYIPIYVPIFTDGTWELLTSVESEFYNPLWAPLLISEMLVNVVLVSVSIYMIYLFFTKHYRFPMVYIGLMLFSIVFIFIDAWAVSAVLDAPMFYSETVAELARSSIGAAIWVPYMLVSKRVDVTFVEKRPADAEQESSAVAG